MQVYLAIYGLRPSPVGAPEALANMGVTIQPGSGFLVLACVGSQLQLYDCVHDCHVARVQVSKRNTSAPRSDNSAPPQPAASCPLPV